MHGRTRGIARAACAAALGLSLALTPITQAVVAYADVDYGTGTVTIKNIEDNDTTFKAYQIFKATKNTDGTASNIAWASDAMRDAVLGVLDADGFQSWLSDNGHTDADAPTSASYAAQYITSKYSTDGELASGYTAADQAAGTGAVIANDELLNKIAAAADDVTPATTVTANQQTSLAGGYWVIVTDSDSIGTGEAGTSPVFALLAFVEGGEDTVIVEKTSLPTITKEIQSDADDSWGKAADSEMDQGLTYRLTATVPSNIDTYGTFHLKFTDNLSAGLTADDSTVKVTVDGHDVTDQLTHSAGQTVNGVANTLTVDIADLKNLTVDGTKIAITKDTQVVVTYTAKLDSTKAASVTLGGAGNKNTARITYSNNPNTASEGDSTTSEAFHYAYKLRVNKVDRDTGEDLSGAKFTIRATDPDDAASKDKYVQADGTLGDTAHEFETDSDGIITVGGLDAGTYTLHETTAPESFQTTDDFTVQISPTYGEDGSLTAITGTTAGNADAKVGVHEGDGLVTAADAAGYVDLSSGQVSVTIGDVRNTQVPVTGAEGILGSVAVGGGIVLISVAGILRRGRHGGDDGTDGTDEAEA